MPYLIAGKAKADKQNYLWQNGFDALTEEVVGIDKDGKFTTAGKPIILEVHGGGILTPDRIFKAYSDGLVNGSAKYTTEEFEELLDGKLPNGNQIQIYNLSDVENKSIPNSFGQYAVAIDFETAKATNSGYYKKSGFLSNPFVHARAGTLEYLEEYYEKAKDNAGDVGNHHNLANVDPNQPQGRVLCLNYGYYGLSGSGGLNYYGRFVGVAPEAP
jgi:hypothetical protein